MDWAPTLADREGPVYRHIVDVLAADIANGRLRRGQQLPTHRALAKALSIDLTTVTRAYTEARRRGLTEARVGLGTFVCETLSHVRHAAAPQPAFDLSINLPPQPMEADLEGRFMRGMAAIQREVGFSAHLNYREPGGSEAEREIAAGWLRSRIADARGDQLVICPGTQNALFNVLVTLTSPGDIILTEASDLSWYQGRSSPYWRPPDRHPDGRGRHNSGSAQHSMPAACSESGLPDTDHPQSYHRDHAFVAARERSPKSFAPTTCSLLRTMPMACSTPVPCRSRHSFPSEHTSPQVFPSASRRDSACHFS